ncbi:hypothetical protein DP939_15805 [Spongiactinospora rosea]|uniref:NACHT domain-containing protein n=1 Tax=Spongiactinospora rosea TaxID=2248750 RepID=A0A366M1C9_9ACTN|nr:hypothetical protein [Spongiactinospora rosea]RBQ19384.1 hypothetical protein DP939_15805 [Spongiactinospora rosea]
MNPKLRGSAAVILLVTGIGGIAVALALRLVDQASGIADTVGVLITALAFLYSRRPDPVSPETLIQHLRAETLGALRHDAQERGLLRPELLPVRLRSRNGDDAWPEPRAAVWSATDFQDHAAGLVTATDGHRRLIVLGPAGAGKSTTAVMMALGLLARGYLPILLKATTWDPYHTAFADWVAKEVVLGRGVRYEHDRGLCQALSDHERTVFLIDGFDASTAHTRRALERLEKEAPHDRHLVLFARGDRIAAPPHYTVHTLMPPKPKAVYKYLRQLAGRLETEDRWRPVLDRVRRGAPDEVTGLLSNPLFLSLARRACADAGDADGDLDPGRLVALVMGKGRAAAEKRLLNEFVSTVMRGRFGTARARRWLGNLAAMLRRRVGGRVAWWQVYTEVPAAVPAVAAGLVLLPAYQLALVMPLGLTRGLAIGLAAGVVLGLLRGVRPSWRAIALAGITASAGVLGIGLAGLPALIPADEPVLPYVIGDTVELGTAFVLTLACRPLLIRRSPLPVLTRLLVPGRVVAAFAVALVACGSASACLVAEWSGARFPLVGGFVAIVVSMGTGTGIATLAARVMAGDLAAPPMPARIVPRLTTALGSPLPYLLRAFPPTVLIGVMAGLTGMVRISLDYGMQIVIVFGLVLGVPVALVIGVLNWLAQPLEDPSAATATTIRRNDGLAAISCVVAIALAATAGILILQGPGQALIAEVQNAPGFHVQPWQGVLFGLTLGVVLASLRTASPAVLVGHVWLAARSAFPWRMQRFLDTLHERGLLRNTGPYYEFSHTLLAEVLDDDTSRTPSTVTPRPADPRG